MTIRRFEEIDAWQEARALAAAIYRISNQGDFTRDFGLRDQIRRASVSVMANVAEGFGRHGKTEFNRFLWISHASALETQSHLYVALDLGYITSDEFEALYQHTAKAARLLRGFINYLSYERQNHKTAAPSN